MPNKPETKTITITVNAEIALEFREQLENFVEDFYGTEKDKIDIGEVQDA